MHLLVFLASVAIVRSQRNERYEVIGLDNYREVANKTNPFTNGRWEQLQYEGRDLKAAGEDAAKFGVTEGKWAVVGAQNTLRDLDEWMGVLTPQDTDLSAKPMLITKQIALDTVKMTLDQCLFTAPGFKDKDLGNNNLQEFHVVITVCIGYVDANNTFYCYSQPQTMRNIPGERVTCCSPQPVSRYCPLGSFDTLCLAGQHGRCFPTMGARKRRSWCRQLA